MIRDSLRVLLLNFKRYHMIPCRQHENKILNAKHYDSEPVFYQTKKQQEKCNNEISKILSSNRWKLQKTWWHLITWWMLNVTWLFELILEIESNCKCSDLAHFYKHENKISGSKPTWDMFFMFNKIVNQNYAKDMVGLIWTCFDYISAFITMCKASTKSLNCLLIKTLKYFTKYLVFENMINISHICSI